MAENEERKAAPSENVDQEEMISEETIEALDDIDALRDALEETRAQAAEYLDGWQRAQAEFANYRKRQIAERLKQTQLASATVLSKLLPILDDFERAIGSLSDEAKEEAWVKGLLLVKQKLDTILDAEGVEPIETEGKLFDPRYHEAVTYEEAEGYDEGEIIGEVQKGYSIGDRVLRPALVRVAKAPSQPAEKSDNIDVEEKGEE